MAERTDTEPHAGRPYMPGYGIREDDAGLLSWSWAQERLTNGRNYFVSTKRPDGHPHSMPVWGVWLNGTFMFSTGRTSRKARNLFADARCVVCPEGADEAVILEGAAEELADNNEALFQEFRRVYKDKYGVTIDKSLGPIFIVRPTKVIGLIENAEKFAASATRWWFPRAAR